MLIRMTIVALHISWGTASVAQDKCVRIKRDIARLYCSDQAFAGDSAQPKVSASEIYTEVDRLLRSESIFTEYDLPVKVGSAFDEANCELIVIRTFAIDQSGNNYQQLSLIVDLRYVASVRQGYGGTEFQMERGHNLLYGDLRSSFNQNSKYDLAAISSLTA